MIPWSHKECTQSRDVNSLYTGQIFSAFIFMEITSSQVDKVVPVMRGETGKKQKFLLKQTGILLKWRTSTRTK